MAPIAVALIGAALLHAAPAQAAPLGYHKWQVRQAVKRTHHAQRAAHVARTPFRARVLLQRTHSDAYVRWLRSTWRHRARHAHRQAALYRARQRRLNASPEAIIRAVFAGHNADLAVRVASCESGLDPRSQNASGASGLFQLMPTWWAGRFDPFDPLANARFAFRLSRGGTDWHSDWYPSESCWG
jgi:Lysozyme like domain